MTDRSEWVDMSGAAGAGRRDGYCAPSHRSSLSSPSDAGTDGLTGTSVPDNTHAFWLGAKRGANSPSSISRVTAKRLNCVAGMNNLVLSANPSDAVSTSPSAAETTPSLFVSTLATSTA